MRAVLFERTGPAADVLHLVDIAMPEPGAGEVRVRVHASGVNPVDVKMRGGARTTQLAFPRISPHSDGAGVIEAVGTGVPAARLGERVWLYNACWGRPEGTAAEYVVVPSLQAVPLPANTSFEAGACFGIPALTAWQAVNMDGGVHGKTVLVAGGAGAVGHYAIQFARAAGAARILASVSGPEKAAIALAAGADVAINYRTEDLVARVLAETAGLGVHRVIEVDGKANLAQDALLVQAEGDVIVYGSGGADVAVPFLPSVVKNLRYRFFIVFNLPPADRAAANADLTRQLLAGTLHHHLGPSFPLEKIAEAHIAVESGAVGNVVVTL
jgi:NADPH2:quinone reductase